METDVGKKFKRDNLRFTDNDNPLFVKLTATKDSVMIRKIHNAATEGIQFLTDIRYIEHNFGPKGIMSFSAQYLDFE